MRLCGRARRCGVSERRLRPGRELVSRRHARDSAETRTWAWRPPTLAATGPSPSQYMAVPCDWTSDKDRRDPGGDGYPDAFVRHHNTTTPRARLEELTFAASSDPPSTDWERSPAALQDASDSCCLRFLACRLRWLITLSVLRVLGVLFLSSPSRLTPLTESCCAEWLEPGYNGTSIVSCPASSPRAMPRCL